MRIVAQFDLIWNQTYDKGVPATKIFEPDATLADVADWVNSVTKDGGQYGWMRMSDIRLSITE